MQYSIRKGFSFGLTSGVITTLGLIVGLSSGTNSRLAVIGGILTIAVADAFSDALGIHISEESDCKKTTGQIWCATIATFVTKFIFASFFMLPFILLPLDTAIIVSVIVGMLTISVFSYVLAVEKRVSPWHSVAEHLFIAIVVVVVTHFMGVFVANYFS